MADSQISPLPPSNARPGDYLVVIHDHEARSDDEIQMKRGDLIRLIELDEEFGDGWWLGEHLATAQKGLLPGGFTKKAEGREYLRALQINTTLQGILNTGTTESPSEIEPVEPSTPVNSSFVTIGSEQSTPQASRPTTSDMMESPKQQRSASSPLPRLNLAADIQQTFRQSIDSHLNGEDSPVMNETLSVIDEHITDMNTPATAEYSSHISHRISYIYGDETDEEEDQMTENNVRKWSQAQTAKHLRGLGVDSKHCDIFEEQEITGDVLLDMNQDFLFMKEFDFGVMGKRLKTWHQVKTFQEEVKGIQPPPQSVRGSISSFGGHDERSMSMSRSGYGGTFLPRIPTVSEKTGVGYTPRVSAVPVQHPRLTSNNTSPVTPRTPPFGHDSPRRVSAASIREFNHSRRHSSIDATTNNRGFPDMASNGYHQKKPSFDRSWTLNNGPQHQPSRPGTSMGSDGMRASRETTEIQPKTSEDLDRGYFSSTEAEARRRRVLHKRKSTRGSSVSQSRRSSFAEDSFPVPGQRQSRIGSVDSLRDAKHMSTAAETYSATPPKNRMRSMSTRVSSERIGNDSQSSNDPKSGFFASLGLIKGKNVGPKMRRAVGFRAISDVIGKNADGSTPVSPVGFDPVSARTGSTTPSATSKSSERHSTDGSGKAGEAPGFMVRPRTVKSKKDTSAYTRGLEKKTPLEQIEGCDYSGWMKKRSSNLMTTWKPRLFVLRGRRLSYYYAEDDTEERGLIDITAHRVLRADTDPIVTLHATVTGSTAVPANANNANPSEEVGDKLKNDEGNKPFFFKLVPPKMNNLRTVQFTKPTTHYFQVDNVKEGRLWMAALMKATIERDLTQAVETTNKQKTISLKQARLTNQRPPALMAVPPSVEPKQFFEGEEDEHGLRIEGLNMPQPSSDDVSFVDATDELTDSDPSLEKRPGEIDTGHSTLLPSPLTKN
ncbi:hypothetical protein N7495_008375 [Penicillium taxi]|uniref:uncharacterized protein n=1 Tax=Penicillium taxi TaxID=168475 RepID=UPI002545868D|nr:uncharacterized protein N7495_008375 [Penicillium taxi]KAJ5888334.1 hypothetical protein N7495_008375 [Penicillium taxi]